jgi:hypothetical protein
VCVCVCACVCLLNISRADMCEIPYMVAMEPISHHYLEITSLINIMYILGGVIMFQQRKLVFQCRGASPRRIVAAKAQP